MSVYVEAPQRSYTSVERFIGYDHALRIEDGAMYDMENMCCDNYPLLSTRPTRGEFKKAYNSLGNLINEISNASVSDFVIDGKLYTDGVVCFSLNPQGIYCLDFYDRNFDYLGKTVELDDITENQEQMVLMNGYLILFPSGYYINVFNLDGSGADNRGFIGAECRYTRPATEGSGNLVATTFRPCLEDGTAVTINKEKPAEPKSGDYWSDGESLKVYNATYDRWDSVVLNYTKMTFPAGAGVKYADMAPFFEGDYVEIGEIEANGEKRKKQYFSFVSTDGTASSSDLQYIILQGEIEYSSIASNTKESSQQVYIKRPMPKLKHVFEHGNRLWGCYYGVDEEGNVINEIYSSALGDFKSWYRYEGISTDSFTATMSVPGNWTGGISYGGYPVFFKEKAIVKVYGTTPSTFQTQVDSFRGVKDGSADSLAIVDEVLFYLSESGIVSYSGGLPQNIDAPLHCTFDSGMAAGCRGKYYFKGGADISMMYVFDTRKGVWYKEGSHNARFLKKAGDNIISVQKNGAKTLFGDNASPFDWFCETGNLGFGSPDYKYITRLQARVRLAELCEMRVFISYDGGDWNLIGTFFGNGITPTVCEVRPTRCGYFRLRFEGSGEADIIQYSYFTEEGSYEG